MAIPTLPSLAGIGWPITRTRMTKTTVSGAISGKETRFQLWAYPKYKWEMPFGVLRTAAAYAEFQTLMGFVNSVAGQALPFYYTDPDDHSVTSELIGQGNGSTTAFQLVRTIGAFIEPVQGSVSITKMTINGVATTAYTSSGAGIVTFNSAPANGAQIAWTGTYTWLCRLATDDSAFVKEMSDYYTMKSLTFQNIKL